MAATQKQLAVHLGVSTRTIRALEKRGVIPARKAGAGYDLDECRGSYLVHLREAAAGRGNADLGEARASLAKAQTERIELRNAITKMRYCRIEEVRRQLEDQNSNVSELLWAIPAQAARDVVGLSDVHAIKATLGRHVADVLTALKGPQETIDAAQRALKEAGFFDGR
jgi:phage terminase Nu1 subunit (DNA packaging protein)